MANSLKNETAIRTAMMFLDKKGFEVSWSGLCVWASYNGKRVKKGSALEKDLAAMGAAYSEKRKAYFLRADDKAELPKKNSIKLHEDEKVA